MEWDKIWAFNKKVGFLMFFLDFCHLSLPIAGFVFKCTYFFDHESTWDL